MKLLHGGLSPFVRKVMIVAHEKGLVERLELVPAPVNPLQPLELAIAINPLGKIPALTVEDGTVLYGSTVIAEYLDAFDGAPIFFPADAAKWTALQRNALGDGLLEAGQSARIEGLRPEDKQWADWKRLQLLKVTNGLDAAEKDATRLATDRLTIGEVSLISALGWFDVRLLEAANWREGRPNLAAWFEKVSGKASVAATAPKVPK
ncbi:glutathione S-transferase N-terminal domain-containing protein [Agrobacterium sp. AGB01]|uniref:glutathione S-transferase N-terminal domain-containing protein n=1 Tax=Agrobacterium sp. AGB01 TaxID=2769302 RepID=UPI0017805F57|nr:glutathione S-transferase N-terminal domain-containing protein [Agrobacterium sp. AGB01]MBD9388486.1 glutathione S-transferase N-terminal domain-containing protein [Agrobacterium sp. AGB01]